jgi:hypothetical protein
MSALAAALLAATPVALAPSLAAALDAALATCAERNHSVLGSEHILHALASAAGDAGNLCALLAAAELPDDGAAHVCASILAALAELKVFAARPALPAGSAGQSPCAVLSEASVRILRRLASLAYQRDFAGSGGPDEAHMAATTPLTEAHLLVAILLEGSSIASEIVLGASHKALSRVSARAALAVVDPALAALPAHAQASSAVTHRIQHESLPHDLPTTIPGSALRPLAPQEALPSVDGVPAGPTETSNWVIPDHLLIGSRPYSRGDVLDLVRIAGVTTFVCLIGEYSSMDRYLSSYPIFVRDLGREERAFATQFLFFPIRDMDVVSARSITDLVFELRQRLAAGEVLFVHCLGGHGRTGMVVAALLCGLYKDVDPDAACKYVTDVTHRTRASDIGWHVTMPETDEQVELVRAVNPYVKGLQRFGR